MSGVHTVYRTTQFKSDGTRYVAIAGSLELPNPYLNRDNDVGTYKNGAFPEFIYGFYAGGKGFDAGILCDNAGSTDRGYKLFIADNGNGTLASSWEQHGAMQVATGLDVKLKVYFTTTGKVRLECYSGSLLKDSLEVAFKDTTTYNTFKSGCFVNLEMVIAINKDNNNNVNLTPGAYFKNAKFHDTTLTTTSGTYVALTTSNSDEYQWYDTGFPTGSTSTYAYKRTVGTMVNGFVSDLGSATTDKNTYPV